MKSEAFPLLFSQFLSLQITTVRLLKFLCGRKVTHSTVHVSVSLYEHVLCCSNYLHKRDHTVLHLAVFIYGNTFGHLATVAPTNSPPFF